MLILSAGAMRTSLDWSFLRLGVAAVVVAGACSPAGPSGPGNDGGANGDDGSEPTTPDGFVSATVGTGTQSPMCPLGSAMPWVTVGEATTGKPATVLSGNDGVTMTCSVRTSGSGYDVSASVTATGSQGGSFTLVSPPGMGAVTLSGGQGIQASFGSTPASATYQESDCVLSFTYLGGPIPDSPSVFPGRIWGHISCPTAQVAPSTTSCDAEADFLLEQCEH
jgi:hypothetical protein